MSGQLEQSKAGNPTQISIAELGLIRVAPLLQRGADTEGLADAQDGARYISFEGSQKVWKLVQKASKGSRSVNGYIQTLIENDLIKRKMLKKSERKKLSSKTSTKRSQ